MADELPGSEDDPPTSRRGQVWTHDWLPFQDYLAIHDSQTERLRRAGVVLTDQISLSDDTLAGSPALRLTGRVTCSDDVVIEVDTWLDRRRDARGRLEVRGALFFYHAWVGSTGSWLFRYCTAHGLDDLHVHRYDLDTGEETSQPRIPLQRLPSLADVILEAVDTVRAVR